MYYQCESIFVHNDVKVWDVKENPEPILLLKEAMFCFNSTISGCFDYRCLPLFNDLVVLILGEMECRPFQISICLYELAAGIPEDSSGLLPRQALQGFRRRPAFSLLLSMEGNSESNVT